MSIALLETGASGGDPGGGTLIMPFAIKYGVGITIPVHILLGSDPKKFAAAADWTPATGDVKVSKDLGADANIGTLPAIITSTTYKWGLVISAAEATCKELSVSLHDPDGSVVDDSFDIVTYGATGAYWELDLGTAMSGQAVASVVGNVGGNVNGNIVGSLATVNDKTGYSLLNPAGFKKNAGFSNYMFPMFDTTGALRTGLSITAQRAIDGGAFAACANAATELGSGLYKITLAASDFNGDLVVFMFTGGTGIRPWIDRILTEP